LITFMKHCNQTRTGPIFDLSISRENVPEPSL
jgi:hypothetical protein